ncbi:MAG: hypothetical protein AB1505_01225 [Candidatus Latescibacterota bacterium]
MEALLALALLVAVFGGAYLAGCLFIRLVLSCWPRARRRVADYRSLAQGLGGRFALSLPGEPSVTAALADGPVMCLQVVFAKYRAHTELRIRGLEVGQDRWRDVVVRAWAQRCAEQGDLSASGREAACRAAAILGTQAVLRVGRSLGGVGEAWMKLPLWFNERPDLAGDVRGLADCLLAVVRSRPGTTTPADSAGPDGAGSPSRLP